jgi:cysteate synthase
MGDYELVCPSCKTIIQDRFTNICPGCGGNSPLLKTRYKAKKLIPIDVQGLWRFLPWLPCDNYSEGYQGKSVVYKSEGLAKELDLGNLFIAFNGYWPDRGANLKTCTFKEFEAAPTLQRATEKGIGNLVLPSAGNTARAFMHAAKDFSIDLYVVVPSNVINNLVLPHEVPENVTVIAVDGQGDYSDAIAIANKMTSELGIVNEGGAYNVARRDGMGTVMLEAVLHNRQIPHHYFQAVGSGTGGIAAWEASERFIADGRFGNNSPKLHLSQNHPFTPMVDAWKEKARTLPEMTENDQRTAISNVIAKVLTNRNPPFSVIGGVFDCLNSSGGLMYSVTNSQLKEAKKLFIDSENIDIQPAASVALASLIQASEGGLIKKDDIILLNITGGGAERMKRDLKTYSIKPNITVKKDTDMEEVRHAFKGRTFAD